MKSLLALLARPQFANLKSLTIPDKVKVGKTSIKQIAKSCPHMEKFVLGYSETRGWTCAHAKSEDIVEAATHLLSLKAIHFDMWTVTNASITAMAEAMGSQLLDLRIRGYGFSSGDNYLSDATLGVLAASCPNLKHFAYRNRSHCYNIMLDTLSGAGVIGLVQACRRLEVLHLDGAKRVTRADFAAIIEMVSASNGDEFALRKIKAAGDYPFLVASNPLRIVETTGENRINLLMYASD